MKALEDTELFETFASSRIRVAIVEWLATRSPPVDLQELYEVVAHECDVPADLVEMRLHHIHLPKLARIGLFAYDSTNLQIDDYSRQRLDDVAEWLTITFPRRDRSETDRTKPTRESRRVAEIDDSPEGPLGSGHATQSPPRSDAED